MNKIKLIINYLDELFPNPKTELIYHNNFELLIAVVLSAQSTDKKVNKVTTVLFNKYNTSKQLKEASLEDLMGIIKTIGMYKKKASYIKNIATIIEDRYNGIIPNKREELEELPGVGRKTANIILSILFNKNYIAVDTHVARISKRLGLADKNDNPLVIEKKLTKLLNEQELLKRHHQMILFGRYYCKAIKPNCLNCKLNDICNYKKKK